MAMDSDVLEERALTKAMVSGGHDLVASLDQSGFHAKAAYWELAREVGKWELIIVLPEGGARDPLVKIRHLLRILDRHATLKEGYESLGLAPRLPSDIGYRELSELMDKRWGQKEELGWLGEDRYFYHAN